MPATEGVHTSLKFEREDESVSHSSTDITVPSSQVVSDMASSANGPNNVGKSVDMPKVDIDTKIGAYTGVFTPDMSKEGNSANGSHVAKGANGQEVGGATNVSKVSDDVESGLSSGSSSSGDRGTWESKTAFLLSCLGYAVGLGNVWRFPYLCYENGGGAFLIPYAIMLFVAGLPIFCLELCIGQFSRSGPAGSWKIAPMFRGIGYGMVLVSIFIGVYYNVILTYTIYYTISSFTNTLPWIGCGHKWNTDMCYGLYEDCLRTGHSIMTDNNTCVDVSSLSEDLKEYYRVEYNKTTGVTDLSNYTDPFKALRKLPSEEYFRGAVLQECLAYLGFNSSGEKKRKLYSNLSLRVWMDAAVQIFFSLSASWGGLLTLSSYNRFHNNCCFDAILIAIANCVTSVFAGFVIFSILGFMAHELGRDVSEVVDQGFGLAFIAYPDVLGRMPFAPVWAVLFFLMLLSLGLDSQFTIMETIVTFITDIFPELRIKKAWVLLVACCSMFLASTICVTEAGVYWIGLLDSYAAGFNILTYATLECLVISWMYGYDRFKNDIGEMIGRSRLNSNMFYYWRISWCFMTPLALIHI
ncbi:sodium- and chloride-dependent neutral and basic amino acid transporter B(0+)-like [Anneissia japonica]|uniref:sodium- and chloride-dependent neutral and basic amino acid transporter B(0+)-like n=1 Tax=Anneissia japonica TaxID=1529436 RepID=UPI001425B87D|nr:sodium- and chloride-dependent neutral and basic amino acid transporter B(0+)-like [Anneissia japonica]